MQLTSDLLLITWFIVLHVLHWLKLNYILANQFSEVIFFDYLYYYHISLFLPVLCCYQRHKFSTFEKMHISIFVLDNVFCLNICSLLYRYVDLSILNIVSWDAKLFLILCLICKIAFLVFIYLYFVVCTIVFWNLHFVFW